MVAPAKFRKPITAGKDFNFFFEDTISLSEFGDADGYANFLTGVRGPAVSFYIKNTGANVLEVSFNGNTLHGRIEAGTERFYPNRGVFKFWFRAPSGSSTVEVEGWAVA